jgi:hypothetical protein
MMLPADSKTTVTSPAAAVWQPQRQTQRAVRQEETNINGRRYEPESAYDERDSL